MNNMPPGAIGTLIGSFLCGLLIFAFVAAIILRVSCSLYNSMAGGEDSDKAVPVPSLGSAMGIAVVTYVVQVIVSFAIGFAIGGGMAAAPGQNPANLQQMQIIASLVSMPFSYLATAACLSSMLPTTFGRACMVVLCEFLVVILIIAVFVGIFMAIGLGAGGFKK